jgi:hypothetical protein
MPAAAIQGRRSEVWINSGSATSFATEACDQKSGTVYHITDTTKRHWDPATTVSVYDNGVLQTSGYHLHPAVGEVHFDSGPTTPVTVSGKYYAASEVTLCQSWELSLESEVYETSSLGGDAYTCVGSGIISASGSIARLFEDSTWSAKAAANATELIIGLYEDEPSDRVWWLYAFCTSWTATDSMSDLIRETIAFKADGNFVYTTDET